MKKLLCIVLLLFGCAGQNLEDTGNDYFSSTAYQVTPGARARSADYNSTLNAIEEGLNKLPTESEIKLGTLHYGVDTGAADAYVVSLPYAPAAYTDGMVVDFKPSASNTGAATINVDGLGVKAIHRQDGTVLVAGDLTAGSIVSMRYNGTSGRFEMQSTNGTASGVGTMAAQNASAVSITGGTIVDVTIDADSLAINGETITTTAEELNLLDGLTATYAELNQLDGVTVGGAAAGDIPTTDSATLASPVINTGVSGTAILDEDTLASNSDTQLATQQSIKAYSDSAVQTMTNKRLDSPKINEDVALTNTATNLNNAVNTTANQSIGGIKNFTGTVQIGGQAVTATPAEINAAADGIGVTIPRQKIVSIGDWNMDDLPYISVAHGLTLSKIRGVTVTIRNDAGTAFTSGEAQLWVSWIDTNYVRIERLTDGMFDHDNFDSTGYNRGWLIIDYVD